MTQFIAKIAIISGLAVSLTGCAQISLVGDNLWGFTKSATNFVTKPVIGLLRPAPKQDYVFKQTPYPVNAYSAQGQVKTAFAQDGAADKGSELIVPNLTRLPVPQTRSYKQFTETASRHYPMQTYRHQQPLTSKTQRQIRRQAQPIIRQAQMQPQPITKINTQDDISFVKIGGGSNMHDWVSCQQDAGHYFQMTQTGYRIDSNFENCMRSKGYKPESEAKAELKL